eukprot:scaffold183_cov108-Isochrysis_galbana.AAC.1
MRGTRARRWRAISRVKVTPQARRRFVSGVEGLELEAGETGAGSPPDAAGDGGSDGGGGLED